MARGGARNRSGPQADPSSEKSERRGYSLTALPSEGYLDDVPEFPLLPYLVMRWEFEDKRRFEVVDIDATEAHRDRESELWGWAWSTPQACAWSLEPWRWHSVAMWVRTSAICESSAGTAADKGSLHRFADQIGLSPAGLKENGWAIARDQVAVKAAENAAKPELGPKRERRLRAVADDQQ